IHQLQEGISVRPITVYIRSVWNIRKHQADNTKVCIGFMCYDHHDFLSYIIHDIENSPNCHIGPIFPVHNFSPQNYKNLLCLATTPTYLPDVVGQILIIQKINPYHPEFNIDAPIGLRLNIILQNKKNTKFKVVIITSIIPKLFQVHHQQQNFYFNKSIDYIKHFKRRIKNHAQACSKE
ncbi:hypothetical protein HID58_001629, partial [Brassica napus]